jgi:hypothetical protein
MRFLFLWLRAAGGALLRRRKILVAIGRIGVMFLVVSAVVTASIASQLLHPRQTDINTAVHGRVQSATLTQTTKYFSKAEPLNGHPLSLARATMPLTMREIVEPEVGRTDADPPAPLSNI